MILHSTHHSAQLISRELSYTSAPVRSKFCLQGHACEGAGNLCATARPVCCTRTCPLSPLKKNMTPKPCPERHPEHEMSRCKHVRKQVSKQWHLDRCAIVQLSSPCQPDAPHLAPRQNMLRHWVTWRSKTSFRQCFGVIYTHTLTSDGKRHIDAHLLQATCYKVVAKTVRRFWAALSENI